MICDSTASFSPGADTNDNDAGRYVVLGSRHREEWFGNETVADAVIKRIPSEDGKWPSMTLGLLLSECLPNVIKCPPTALFILFESVTCDELSSAAVLAVKYDATVDDELSSTVGNAATKFARLLHASDGLTFGTTKKPTNKTINGLTGSLLNQQTQYTKMTTY